MITNYIDTKVNEITQNGTLLDLYEIADINDIIVYEDNLGENTPGAYHYEYRIKIIMINSTLSYYHKMIVLAHEIAHAFLHPYEEANFTTIGCVKNVKENEANYFTCKLLDVIGFWKNEELCIYEHEMSKSDIGFIGIYKNYMKI